MTSPPAAKASSIWSSICVSFDTNTSQQKSASLQLSPSTPCAPRRRRLEMCQPDHLTIHTQATHTIHDSFNFSFQAYNVLFSYSSWCASPRLRRPLQKCQRLRRFKSDRDEIWFGAISSRWRPWRHFTFQRIRGCFFGVDALYKLTFYLLTFFSFII